MRRELLHWMLSWPLAMALVGWASAQDGPLLPGLENSAPIEDAAVPIPEPEPLRTPVVVPSEDDIRPLDANGIPQSGPPFGGELALPDPPAIEPKVGVPPKRNWLQKSTETIRGLSKPDSTVPEPNAPKAKPDDKKTSDAIRNWQMLRRRPTNPNQTAPGQRLQTHGTVLPQEQMPSYRSVPPRTTLQNQVQPPQDAMQSKRAARPQSPMNSKATPRSQPQMRPPVGVEAKNRGYQQPSSRRQVQAAPGQRAPQAKSQMKASPKAIEPHRTADNGPRSPWEHPGTGRLRPAASAIKAAPAQSTGIKPTTLRSALGLEAPASK